MGIGGLLPLLKSIQRQTTLKTYAGQTLGVDGFGWLHRGAIACAYQLVNDIPTTAYIQYMITWVRMLQDFGIVPYLVFDGDSVPSKSGTNDKRRQDRAAAKALAQELERSGKRNQARQEWLKAISITPQMTFEVIQALRKMDVSVVVAPYEADAQLAFLEKSGIINGIISEDSDLLVFGAQRLITKLDKHGSCVEIQRKDFILNRDLSFAGWSDSMFRRMAILSGCDYLPSISRVGLTTAHGYVKKHKDINKILRAMAMSGKLMVPADYLDKFNDAERTFLYHRVFCPKQGRLVLLNTLPPDLKEEDMPYLGKTYDSAVAVGVACGDLNPRTKEPFKSTKAFSVPGSRPLESARRHSSQNTPTLKAKGSLDSFFKPQRVPLAELDPNSLTPSPSQQRLLARNRNATWESVAFSNPSFSAPAARRTLSQTPVPSPVSQDRARYLAKAGAVSNYKPSKRPRLCSESDEVSPSKEVKHSRFFVNAQSGSSTPTLKKGRERSAKKATFDVWSDDSVEEALLSLEKPVSEDAKGSIRYPDLPPNPANVTESDQVIDIVPQSSPTATPELVVDSQSSHGTVELNHFSLDSNSKGQTVAGITPARNDRQQHNFTTLLEYHLQQSNEAVKTQRGRTFTFQSPEKQAAALASLGPPQPDTIRSPHQSARYEPTLDEIPLPAGAAGSPKFRGLATTFANQSSSVQARALASLKQQKPAPKALAGSEDFIPASSPPAEDFSDADEDDRLPRLNLKSFVYSAD